MWLRQLQLQLQLHWRSSFTKKVVLEVILEEAKSYAKTARNLIGEMKPVSSPQNLSGDVSNTVKPR